MFDPEDNIKYAKGIDQRNQPAEVEIRNGIICCYYAVYHIGGYLAKNKFNYSPPQNNRHKALWCYFGQHADNVNDKELKRKLKRIGLNGDRLKIQRVEASYRYDKNLTIHYLQQAISSADSLISLIKGI